MYNRGTLEGLLSVDYSAIPPQELILVCLQRGEESAWVEFVRRFQPLIASVVLRITRQWGEASPQLIDDLIQETYLKLCAENFQPLKAFESRHEDAIYGFIKVFTANLVHDHFKASRAQKRGGSAETSSLDADATPEPVTQIQSEVATFERKLLLGQVARCLEAVAAGPNVKRDCRIFWLYYRAGLSASAIASLPTIGLSVKGVESTILRLTRAVRQRLVPRKLEQSSTNKEVEGIGPAESL
jgi:RNA polymerase sigma-70 factor, ECF subfamily